MPPTEFQRCSHDDLEELRDVSLETFRHAFESQNNPEDFARYLEKAFSQEQLSLELGQPDVAFYWVRTGGETAGYFKLNTGSAQTELRQANGMEIERIYVRPPWQGCGIGAAMLDYIRDLARQNGKTYLWLGVWELNLRAINFYERHGYVRFGTHPYYIGDDRQTDWLMRLDLY